MSPSNLSENRKRSTSGPKRFCLLGASLGTGNRGVSALSASVVKLGLGALKDAEPVLLIGNRDSKPFSVRVNKKAVRVNVVNFRMSPKAKPNEQLGVILLMSILYRALPVGPIRGLIKRRIPWIREAVEADFVGEIRGGDSFSDIYGLKRFLIGSLPVLMVILTRGSVALLPQTYGPFKGRVARMLARYILRHASVILSRDRQSVEAVRELVGSRYPVEVTPDVAFALDPYPPEKPAIEPPLPRREEMGCLIGLNVNGLVYNGGYTRSNMFGLKLDYPKYLEEFTKAVLSENPGNRILLVPHTIAPPSSVESDPGASVRLRDAIPEPLRSRIHLVTKDYDQSEMKGVIGSCDFFVGGRMHACIAAVSQEIPCVAIAYSRKFRGVFDSVDMGDCVLEARDLQWEAALQRSLELLRDRERIRSGLNGKVVQARERLETVFDQLMKIEAKGR